MTPDEYKKLMANRVDRRKTAGSILYRKDYSFSEPNIVREKPYEYGNNSIAIKDPTSLDAALERHKVPVKECDPITQTVTEWKPEKIRALRKSMKLTQAGFGLVLGVGWITVWRLENNIRKPKGAILKLLIQMGLTDDIK